VTLGTPGVQWIGVVPSAREASFPAPLRWQYDRPLATGACERREDVLFAGLSGFSGEIGPAGGDCVLERAEAITSI
jgi:hypothetical protein